MSISTGYKNKAPKRFWFISTPQLNPLLGLHLGPIKVVVSNQPISLASRYAQRFAQNQRLNLKNVFYF